MAPKIRKKPRTDPKLLQDLLPHYQGEQLVAYYHPVTEKLLLITDGVCSFHHCAARDEDDPCPKLPIPESSFGHFQTHENGHTLIGPEHKGKLCACLYHAKKEHQKEYLETGILPEGALRKKKKSKLWKKSVSVNPLESDEFKGHRVYKYSLIHNQLVSHFKF
jgi:hypothetical protein